MAIELSAKKFLQDWAKGDGPRAAVAQIVLMQFEDMERANAELRAACKAVAGVYQDYEDKPMYAQKCIAALKKWGSK